MVGRLEKNARTLGAEKTPCRQAADEHVLNVFFFIFVQQFTGCCSFLAALLALKSILEGAKILLF